MSALGNLVAGVAHEINNPISCIVGNIAAIERSITDLFDLFDLYRQHFPQPGEDIETELEAIDLDYLREDLPKLLQAMKDSGDRIITISKSLRTFSRSDSDRKQSFNLHEGLDSTILILRHRLKANEHRPEIEVVRDCIFNDQFTTKEVGKGTGLGLAISRQIIVDKHDGSLEVNSIIGQGSEVIISLPVKQN
jgi:signal transduction histidine kinase